MVAIRYAAPDEPVFRWIEALGPDLKSAATTLVSREKWKLGGTIESLAWKSVTLVVPANSSFTSDDASGPQGGWSNPGPTMTRRRAQIICVSTGADGPGLLIPPGKPRQSVLNVTVPADTEPGEISLL